MSITNPLALPLVSQWTTPRKLEELPRPQPQMMDIKDLRRPSTAPQTGGPGFPAPIHSDAMQWAPNFSWDYADAWGPVDPGTAPSSATHNAWGPGTPGTARSWTFTTPLDFPPPPPPPPARHDLSRYSLSIPNSAPTSPGKHSASRFGPIT